MEARDCPCCNRSLPLTKFAKFHDPKTRRTYRRHKCTSCIWKAYGRKHWQLKGKFVRAARIANMKAIGTYKAYTQRKTQARKNKTKNSVLDRYGWQCVLC